MKQLTKSLSFSLLCGALVTVFSLLLGFAIALGDGADLTYRTLDYDVQVEPDGDLRIVETVDIRLDKREDGDDNVKPWKQLYQQYTLRSSNLTNITDVSVRDLATGEEYARGEPGSPSGVPDAQWNSEHANRWYLADVSYGDSSPMPYDPATDGLEPDGHDSRTVELGWNIPVTERADSMRFRIAMTWEGVSTEYEDVVKFQWEPFGASNRTPIGMVHARVRFPEGVGESDSWAWLHYAGDAVTTRTADGLDFTARNVPVGEYLDLVAMFDDRYAHGVTRHDDVAMKQWTIDDETRQEREWRDKERRRAIVRLVVWGAFALAGLLLSFFAVRGAIRSVRRARYDGPIEYWREPPRMSPGAAACLYDVVVDGRHGALFDRQMAASIMSLATKGAVAVYPGEASLYRGIDMSRADSASLAAMLAANAGADAKALSKTSTIVLLPRALAPHHEELNLCASEELALGLLVEAYERIHCPVFDVKQMGKAFKNWSSGHLKVEGFTKACQAELDALHATEKVGVAAHVCGLLDITLGVIGAILFMGVYRNLALGLCVGAPMILLGLFAVFYAKDTGITPAGQEYAGEVRGLARYLEDFSMFDERDVLDLTLWGRYLVYATAFGISDKVMAQLRAAYPQLGDPTWLDDNVGRTSSLLYWSTRPSTIIGGAVGGFAGAGLSGGFGDLGSQLSAGFSSIGATIQAAAPSSSGGGSGGSFSGGSFGGSGGGSGGGSFGGR